MHPLLFFIILAGGEKEEEDVYKRQFYSLVLSRPIVFLMENILLLKNTEMVDKYLGL